MEVSQTETNNENQPELIIQTEQFYFLLSHNLTKEAKNIIWGFLQLAKVSYTDSKHKKEWNQMLVNLQTVIDDFENQLAEHAVMHLYGLQRSADELKQKENT